MKCSEFRNSLLVLLALAVTLCALQVANGEDALPNPKTYVPDLATVEQHKAIFDDPRPYLVEFGPKQVLPPELYEKLTYDIEAMKKEWAEIVGFKATDLVGKIAPEIKPGKYTHEDVKNNPAFKELMWPRLYNRIKPGGPPHAGCIPEFTVVPTRQYYWSLPVARATKENAGKTQLDKDGYLIPETWISGYPFPKPEGPFKAQQIMANVEKRYLAWGGNMYLASRVLGLNKDLKTDFDGAYDVNHVRLAGRVLLPPYGWMDKRARERGEAKMFILNFLAPRDIAGAAQSALYYLDPNAMDQLMIFLPSLRRVRKMSATDTQDPIMGQDQIYDDNEGWMQKLSPTRYPYTFEVLEEREYLLPAATLDGSCYIGKDGFEFRNLEFERRPLYVVKMTQQDPNYVYSYRILYIDKETFVYYHVENYDQKGRLYRTWDGTYSFFPEMGSITWSGMLVLLADHIDLHSTAQQPYQLPSFWTREDISMAGMLRKAK